MVAKILIMGLPGAGKTTLARSLADKIGAALFNADEIRANINKDLGFSIEDRVEQARRMGWLCDRVVESGHTAIADLVCPTPQSRAAFGEAFIVFVDRIAASRFADTNELFTPPTTFDMRIPAGLTPGQTVDRVYWALRAKGLTDRPTNGLLPALDMLKARIGDFVSGQRLAGAFSKPRSLPMRAAPALDIRHSRDSRQA